MTALPKYELIQDQTIELHGHNLFRIRSLRDIGGDVRAGDVGGYVAGHQNLSHDGTCWIYDDASASGESRVSGDACLFHKSKAFGSSQVSGKAILSDYACAYDFAVLSGDTVVAGSSVVRGSAHLYGYAHVSGAAVIEGHADVSGLMHICGAAYLRWSSDCLSVQNFTHAGETLTAFRTLQGGIGYSIGLEAFPDHYAMCRTLVDTYGAESKYVVAARGIIEATKSLLG